MFQDCTYKCTTLYMEYTTLLVVLTARDDVWMLEFISRTTHGPTVTNYLRWASRGGSCVVRVAFYGGEDTCTARAVNGRWALRAPARGWPTQAALTQPTACRDMMNPPPSRCGDAATTTTHRALAVSRFYFPITPTNSTFLFVYKRRERELGAPRFLSPPKGEDRNSRERGREAEGKQGRIRNLAGGAG